MSREVAEAIRHQTDEIGCALLGLLAMLGLCSFLLAGELIDIESAIRDATPVVSPENPSGTEPTDREP